MQLLWKLLAWLLSMPVVASWLIERSQRTPYYPIMTRNGIYLYMDRWWLFNPYDKTPDGRTAPARHSWLPSVRVHHICLPDDDQHEHDHPWAARTIILRGWYVEERRSHRLTGGGSWRQPTAGWYAPLLHWWSSSRCKR